MIFFKDARAVLPLVWRDIRFELGLSSCMVLAFAAVFFPLFLLLGIKNGVSETLLKPLREDAESRLVKPDGAFEISGLGDDFNAFLQGLRARARVVILSPEMSMPLAIEKGYATVDANAIPSADDDPVLTREGLSFAGVDGWPVILAEKLATRFDKNRGDQLVLRLSRVRPDGKRENFSLPVRVAGVARTEEVKGSDKLWMPAERFAKLIAWQERGLPLPEAKSPGLRERTITPEYDGIVVVLPKLPSEDVCQKIMEKSGSVLQPVEVTANELGLWAMDCQEIFGITQGDNAQKNAEADKTPETQPADGCHILLWRPTPKDDRYETERYEKKAGDLRKLYQDFSLKTATLPWVEELDVQLTVGEATRRARLAISPPGWDEAAGGALGAKTATGQPSPTLVWASEADKLAGKGDLWFSSQSGLEFSLPVVILSHEQVAPGHFVASQETAGRLNAARHQPIVFDAATGEMYRGPKWMFFRAYAPSIDQLEDLASFVKDNAHGIRQLKECRAPSLSVVKRNQQLCADMENLYWLMFIISFIATLASVFANVTAGIQRKKFDLAYLRLLGVKTSAVLLLPCVKNIALVLTGMAASGLLYALYAVFEARLIGKNLVMMPFNECGLICLIILAGALLFSLLASLRVYRIDPAEYIHE